MFQDTAIARFPGPWGVPIEIGRSLPLLLFILVSLGGGLSSQSLSFVAVVLGSIILHELGHAWGCVVQGVPVDRVMIYGGGGYCQPGRSTSRQEDELIVAMGPIVNIVLWALASLALSHLENHMAIVLVWQIMMVNLFLVIFNLLPVQPLDGGRLFLLILARFLPIRQASRVAGFFGLIIAVLWIPGMVAAWFYLGFILLFIPPIKLHWEMMRGER